MKKKKLTLVIPTMGMGGAQRALTLMANYWVKKGHQVSVITLDSGKIAPGFKLDPMVEKFSLGIAERDDSYLLLPKNIWYLWKLRKYILKNKPDFVLPFMEKTGIVVLFSLLFSGQKTIVLERTNPWIHYLHPIWHFLRRLFYPFAKAIVTQSKKASNYFEIWEKKCMKVATIPNPIVLSNAALNSIPPITQKEKKIIASGRLSSEKCFDQLIESFSKSNLISLGWTLDIIGEGHDRKKLENKIKSCKVSDSVCLLGWKENPWEYYKKSKIFVMFSLYEGFPNALLEAMAMGCACICSDCPCGPKEIIEENINGLFVRRKSKTDLTNALDKLGTDEKMQEKLSHGALKITERYSIIKIMKSWEKLLESF